MANPRVYPAECPGGCGARIQEGLKVLESLDTLAVFTVFPGDFQQIVDLRKRAEEHKRTIGRILSDTPVQDCAVRALVADIHTIAALSGLMLEVWSATAEVLAHNQTFFNQSVPDATSTDKRLRVLRRRVETILRAADSVEHVLAVAEEPDFEYPNADDWPFPGLSDSLLN